LNALNEKKPSAAVWFRRPIKYQILARMRINAGHCGKRISLTIGSIMAQNIRKLIAQSSTQTMRTYQNVKCVIKRNKKIIIKSSSSADAKFINGRGLERT
jgi:hypothetical protein